MRKESPEANSGKISIKRKAGEQTVTTAQNTYKQAKIHIKNKLKPNKREIKKLEIKVLNKEQGNFKFFSLNDN